MLLVTSIISHYLILYWFCFFREFRSLFKIFLSSLVPSMRKVKIVEIGAWRVSTNRHIPSLIASWLYDVVGIISLNKKDAKKLADKYHIANFWYYDDQYDIDFSLNRIQEADAFMIGTSPDSHYYLAKSCILHGKHVLMEKPMTLDEEQSRELVQLSKAYKVKFAIVHNFQFTQSIQSMDRAVESWRLWKILWISASQISTPLRRLPVWHEELPLGLFFDESPHLLYLMQKFWWNIYLVQSDVWWSLYKKNTPSLVIAQFTNEDNIPIIFSAQFESTLSERYIIIHGEKKMGIVDIFRDIYIELDNDGSHTPKTMVKTTRDSIWQHVWWHVRSVWKVIIGRYFVGNESVVKLFYNAIVHDQSLGAIDCEYWLQINAMQFSIIHASHYHNVSWRS